jgi:hypothetical protein
VGRDLLGFFAIEVGYASSGDAPVGRGELHVAGKMIPAAVENQTSQMGVGISYGSGSAIGFATIGMVEDGESTGIGVGNVFGAGSAIGVLEIGSGDIAAVAAGLVYGDGTATGSLSPRGVDGVYVGVSGNGFYDPSLLRSARRWVRRRGRPRRRRDRGNRGRGRKRGWVRHGGRGGYVCAA